MGFLRLNTNTSNPIPCSLQLTWYNFETNVMKIWEWILQFCEVWVCSWSMKVWKKLQMSTISTLSRVRGDPVPSVELASHCFGQPTISLVHCFGTEDIVWAPADIVTLTLAPSVGSADIAWLHWLPACIYCHGTSNVADVIFVNKFTLVDISERVASLIWPQQCTAVWRLWR